MANVILDKFGATTAITITLAGLSNAASPGVGRQSTIIDNTTTRYQDVLLFVNIMMGGAGTANSAIYIYLIRDDGGTTPIRTDDAGATDAAWTAKNASLVGTLVLNYSPATGDILKEGFLIRRPGPKWGIGIVNTTGVSLDATAGNHSVTFVGLNPEVQ